MTSPQRPSRLRLVPLAAVALACSSWTWWRGSQGADNDLAILGLKQMNVSRTVKDSFPGAMKGSVAFRKTMRKMRRYGIRKHNTMYGQSISPDEINRDKGHLPAIMEAYFGHAFSLGGLGGVPFAGKTGFMAFSNHVPDDGHVVVVFGPHIGYTMDAEAGKFRRDGQKAATMACDAVTTAYSQVRAGAWADPKDPQQSWLKAKLRSGVRKAARSDNPVVDLTMEAYKVVEKEVMTIVNTQFGNGNLILIGGVQINMPYPMNGFWMPIHFSVRSAGEEPVDLMDTFS